MKDSVAKFYLERFNEILKKFEANNAATIPFCAAEPLISDFVKNILTSDIQERYICGSVSTYDIDNFIGSEFIYPLYEEINKISKDIFNSNYTDPRPLSGMNAAISTLMSITKNGDKVLLLSVDSGAHDSFKPICERLGLDFHFIPYNYDSYQIDYSLLNQEISKNEYSLIIIPPSDIISPPSLDLINLTPNCRIYYDVTQTLGLIGAGLVPNPLDLEAPIVLSAGTHKTFPGPTSGLILTNDSTLKKQIDTKVSPHFVRNPQPHQIASLLLALIEFLEFGHLYMKEIVANANYTARELEKQGFNIVRASDTKYTQTHQIFILLDNERELELMIKNAQSFNISIDKKSKKIFNYHGIRLGLQAVTRLGWKQSDFKLFAEILNKLRSIHFDEQTIIDSIKKLPNKGGNKLKFTFK